MLPSRGLLRTSPGLGIARTTLPRTSARPFPRHFSTVLRNSRTALSGAQNARRIVAPLAATVASQRHFSLWPSGKKSSSEPAAPPEAVSESATTPSPIPEPTTAQATTAPTIDTSAAASTAPVDPAVLPDISGTPLGLSGSDLLDIPEQIGFLKTLGLDFGWGPTSLMQTLLESIYVYTGLPWWASIAAVAVLVRLVLAKPALDASENALILKELFRNPKYAGLHQEMKYQMIAGNHLAATQTRAKIQMMHKEAGYSMLKNFVPFIQLPLAIGMFRLIKGMSALPVPSLETGGILWFTDLTVPDPLFILPIASALLMGAGMRITLPYMAPQQQKTMRVMALVVMPISAIATSFLSSGITWYFLVSAALHTIQTWLMHQPWFRRIVRLPPLQAQAPAAPVSGGVWHAPRVINASAPRVHVSTSAHSPAQPAHESLFDSLKKSIADTKKAMDERADRFEAERAIKTAQEYEEKRALEEKERLLARLERKKGRY